MRVQRYFCYKRFLWPPSYSTVWFLCFLPFSLYPPGQALVQLLKREERVLVMFYAPWCGFCKRMKPDYATAATELRRQGVMAAMDVNLPENYSVRQRYNITGFPTLLYFV